MTDYRIVKVSAQCGSLTIHTGNAGVGYLLGPRVKVIDIIGLTDRFIADLPNTLLVARPRVGHPVKYIPLAYLAQQQDVSVLRNWWIAIRNLDCAFRARTEPLRTSPDVIHPFGFVD